MNVDKYCFQLEKTREETDELGANYHLQGNIKLKVKDRKRPLTVKINSTPYSGMHLSPSSSPTGLSMYVIKKESRFKGPWSDKDSNEYMYKGDDIPTELLMWQASVKNYILDDNNDDNRKILWIVDTAGCHGKSLFCKYMAVSYTHLTLPTKA